MAAAPTAAEHRRSRPRRGRRPRVVLADLAVVLVAAMALDTTWKKGPVKLSAGGRQAFSAPKYGRDTFPKVSAAIKKSAVPLPTLVTALRKDESAAGRQYGHREGSSPPAFATSAEGVAG